MLEWASSVPCDDEKDGYTDERYEVERQEKDELNNLPQAEGAVDCTFCWFSKHFGRILRISVKYSGLPDKILEVLVDQDTIKDVHQSFINQECLEEECYDYLTFTKDQESCIDPCSRPVKNV